MAAGYVEHRLQREGMLECNVCFERYDDACVPKNLDCGHICCQICLKQMLMSSKKKGHVTCPECRCQTRIPRGKIENLTTNFTVKSLAEHEQNTTKSAKPSVKRSKSMRTRVSALRDRQSVMTHLEKSDTTSNDEELETLRLKIECLEQQLQQQQDFPNEPNYISVISSLEDLTIPEFHHSPVASPTAPLSPSAPPFEESYSPSPPPVPSTSPPSLKLTRMSDRQRMSLPDIPQPPTHAGASSLYSPRSPLPAMLPNPGLPRRSLPSNTTMLQHVTDHHATPHGRQVEKKHLQPIEEFGRFEQAQGIALTADGLLAVCDFKGEAVVVFQRKKKGGNKYQKKFNLALYTKNVNRPADVAATLKGEFLVARRTGVELYTPKGKYARTIPKSYQDTLGVCTVATATDGRVFVGDIAHYAILVYDAQARTVLHTFNTGTKPARITTLGDHSVAVCHARLGHLEVFDVSSLTIGGVGSIKLMDNIPEAIGMCYDPDTGCILVVRNERIEPGSVKGNTGVIEQYHSTTGELIAVLAEGLHHPFNLAFISREILAVADKMTVKLFQVREVREVIYQ